MKRCRTYPKLVVSLISIGSCLIFCQARATTIHVPADQPTIKLAVSWALTGDTVLVADGVYSGAGNVDIDFSGKSLVVMSVNGPEFTTIDCGGDSLVPQRAFLLTQGEDSTAVIRGFTVTGGVVTEPNGGAILCRNSSPRIVDCRFIENRIAFDFSTLSSLFARGGALGCFASNVRIDSCSFVSNIAHRGGAIYADSSSDIRISHSQFRDNRVVSSFFTFGSGGSGGAIDLRNSGYTILNSTFTANTGHFGAGVFANFATGIIDSCTFLENVSIPFGTFDVPPWGGRGGGIALFGGTLELSHSFFIGNTSLCLESYTPGWGGALECENSSVVDVSQCTFYGNLAEDCDTTIESRGQGAVMFSWNSELTVDASIVAFNQGTPINCFQQSTPPTVTCSDFFGNLGGDWSNCVESLAATQGNFSYDPNFCDTSQLDFSLEPGSPCAPSNNSCQVLLGASDIDCANVSCCDLPGDANGSETVNIGDATFLINWIFSGGAALPCVYESDSNGSSTVNISDATYIIAYIFTGGSPPICGTLNNTE